MLKDTIKALNEAIQGGDNTILAYNIVESMTVDKNTILCEVGSDAQVSIDDAYNAVFWHRLISADYKNYEGRGAVNQAKASYLVKILCYSKRLDFVNYIERKIQSDNTLELVRSSFDKDRLLKSELPEAQSNFDINHYFFSIEYKAKALVSSSCGTSFCWD